MPLSLNVYYLGQVSRLPQGHIRQRLQHSDHGDEMRFFFLLINRLAQYYRKNKVIFMLFVIGGAINALVFCFFYGNLLPAVTNRNSQEIQYREYFVRYFDEVKMLDEKEAEMKEIQNSGLFESVRVCWQENNSLDGRWICASVFGESPLIRLKGTLNFTSDRQVLVPLSCSADIGSSITLMGESFQVVGQHTSDEYYISYTDFAALDCRIWQIYAVTNSRQDFTNDLAEQLLSNTFSDGDIKTPRIYELSDKGLSLYNTIMICSTFLIATISFMFLLRYLMDSLMDENIVSIIVGASKRKMVLIIFCESLILFLAVSIIGLLLHYALYIPVFSKINITEGLVYSFGDYLRILTGIFFIVLACLIPFLGKYTKMSPIRLYQRHI